MITKITILSNGNIAPDKTIPLGHKYDNALDKLHFIIPDDYKGYYYYLAFYMKKHDAFLLPLNEVEEDCLELIVTSSITRFAGQYEMVFIATKQEIVDGDITNEEKVFVSGIIRGVVEDNFLTDPVLGEPLDENLQIVYDKLNALITKVNTDLANDAYRGAVYIPTVNEDGVLSFERSDGKDIDIPVPRNLTGPTGPYYIPRMDNGILNFDKSAINIPDVPNTNVTEMVEKASNDYLDTNLVPAIEYELSEKDDQGNTIVERAVNAKFKFTWNPETKILYIETEDLETIPEKSEGVKF